MWPGGQSWLVGGIGVVKAALAVGLGLTLALRNFPVADETHNRATREDAVGLLTMIPQDGLLLMPPCCDFYGRAMAVQYLQQVEGIRTDVAVGDLVIGDQVQIVRPSFLPPGHSRVPGFDSGVEQEREAYVPQVGVTVRGALEQHLVLAPIDTSRESLGQVVDGLPPGSIVTMVARQPIRYSVDQHVADEVVAPAMRSLGFGATDWRGHGAHVMVGVKGAQPGTAIDNWAPVVMQVAIRRGASIGATGKTAPTSIRLESSAADAEVVVNGRDVSTHHWGYTLLVLAPSSGEVVLAAHFDTEAFLLNNVRAYRVLGLRRG
jgi:hypothetical protein